MKRICLPMALGLAAVFGLSSCVTTYDAYGRPVQTVDPGMAAVGIAGAALVGYALADDGHHHHHHHHRPRPRHYPSHGGYYR